MGALTVVTCGEPLIAHDNVACAISIRKVLALGLYLAVTGRPHTREQLIALFWPDANDAHGHVNLRQALRRLRHALGSDADVHLIASGDLIRLDLASGGSVDVALLHAATSPQALPANSLTALNQYAGAFLADLALDDAPDFMEWVAAQRAYWEGCYDLVAEREIQRMLDVGNATDAEALGHAWVARRPECEAAYRLLAIAQATLGDVGGARLTLATAMRRWEELGLPLSPETLALQDRIGTLASAEAARHTLALPFVGRAEAFAHLRHAWRDVTTGQCGVVLLEGEAGIGKSRLVDRFAQWARIQGSDVAIGHAYELSGRLPYHPISELVRERLAREHAPDDLLEDSWLIELQRLAPDLHDRYPDLPLPADDATAGTRLLEAIAQVGIAFSRRRPLVWVVEDLHWADEATCDTLLYVTERWRAEQLPALVICTVRSEELAGAVTLSRWRNATQRSGAMTKVALPPWSAVETQQAITSSLGESASPELCGWLYEQTQGNPLYLMHIMQALEEHSLIRWQHEHPQLSAGLEINSLRGWLPQSLQGVLLRRVRRLDAKVQHMLAAAAVLGSRFREDLLAPVAGMTEDDLITTLEAAEQSLLIRADGQEYVFTHDKVAAAVYSELALARRRLLHRRVLRALESVATARGAESPAELAHHAFAAEEWEKAARYYQQAAERAQQIGAHRDAMRYYEQVVRLLSTSPSQQALGPRFSDEPKRVVYSRLGLLYRSLGETKKARLFYEEALAHARRTGARLLEGHVLIMMGNFIRAHDGDWVTAQQLFVESLQIAVEQGDTGLLLRTEMELAFVAEELGEYAQAMDYARHVVPLARAGGDMERLAQILNDVSDVYKRSGDWEAACAACEESLVLFAHLAEDDTTFAETSVARAAELPPQPFTPALAWTTFLPRIAPLARHDETQRNSSTRRWGANALMGMGNARLHLGEGDIGRAALQMGWQIFTEQNEPRFHQEYLPHWTLGWLEAGDFERALQDTQQVLEAAATAPDRPFEMMSVRPFCALADAHHALYQLADARPALERAAAFAPGKSYWERLLPATRWCTQHALAGEWREAATAAREAQALRYEAPSPLTWFDFARYYETEALLRVGDRAQAEADARRLGEHLGANRRYRLVYLRMQALLDRAAGEHTAAAGHLSAALTLALEMSLPGETWQIAAELATSHGMLGDVPRAEEAKAQSETIIEHLAARITDLPSRNHFAQASRSRRPALTSA